MKLPRLSPQTFRVLVPFVDYPTAWGYGYELSWDTGWPSATFYPILMRLAKYSLPARSGRWITPDPASTLKNFGSL